MKLSAPKQLTFCIAVILLIVGVIANFITIPVVSAYAFWLTTISAILLVLGCFMKGF